MPITEIRKGDFKEAFGPDDLEMLDVAYRLAWTKLQLRNPEGAEAVKDFLRQRVVQIAKYGVKDADTLSGLALDMLPKAAAKARRRKVFRMF